VYVDEGAVEADADSPEEADKPRPPLAPPPDRPHFLLRPLEVGLIVAFSAEDPFPGTRAEWGWVFNAVGADRWLWYRRHGMSAHYYNQDFWNFLIPGVGLAPVVEFCVLITLFVVAIGPVNYLLLRRWRRLHLLVITIPASAATVTLLLFGYALFTDGLGTRVRARSVTRLDQRSGRAVCWARLSYYAGLAPRRGLSFPADVAALPLEQAPVEYYGQPPLRRELFWQGDQNLASGWLRSRTPMQLITVRSRPSNRTLELIRPGDGSLAVDNRLGSRIEQLLVCPASGELCWAEGIEAGARTTLEPVEPAKARQRLRRTCRAHQPALPAGMDQSPYGGLFGVSRRRMWASYNYPYSNGMAGPTQRTSRLERELAKLGAPSGAKVSLLEPGSYVAVVRRSPEVVLGTPAAQEEESYHVILGNW